jgi:hypothetical protein
MQQRETLLSFGIDLGTANIFTPDITEENNDPAYAIEDCPSHSDDGENGNCTDRFDADFVELALRASGAGS